MTIDLGIVPREWQRRVHRERKRFSVLVLHRRAGKTVFAELELMLGALDTPNGRFAYVAPFYAQAKAVAWDGIKDMARRVPGAVIKESELKVELPNGATVRLFGADNANALRGLGFDGIVVDEVADIEPFVWGEVLRPALTDRLGWCIFIGTAKGVNLFSERYYAALRDPSWYAISLTVEDTGALDPAEVEAAKAEMSEAQFAAEMMCVFSAGGVNILIPQDRIEAAAVRTIHEAAYHYAGRALGVDPARFGDDSTALIVRQGFVSHGLRRVQGADTMQVADLALSMAKEHEVDAIFVDDGGLGAGVVDRLRSIWQGTLLAVNFGSRSAEAKYLNKRAECWGRMAEWLKEGVIPNDQQLKTDLATPTFKFDIQSRIVLESKAEMKKRGMKSPDAGDALALTFAIPLAAREVDELAGYRRVKRDGMVHEYDPFAEAGA